MDEDADAVAELTADHRAVDALFEELQLVPSGRPARRVLLDRVTVALVRHAVAEEEYLYPAVRRHVPEGGALADREIAGHAEIERLLKDLEGRPPHDPGFDALVVRLINEVTGHVHDEERHLFPLLRESCPGGFLTGLGARIRRAERTAPTRPHPGLPGTPPANRLLAPGAGLVDRVRDALGGRGRF
ncbi:hemerythrin domain-containing protein [Streptomyces zingiberis]|uniref:Hemerythrin domain-containing protein n=1 Tax=Streptomyces zingiberis TaxID=2053010 RepID=A0ABX1C152_9ACTN|nr:hemerythrin domain-containing protein [Streptomyces zingiberis]NJQ01687.1 hemerythrin domain-containing protein [Streptomyces zingiberis]